MATKVSNKAIAEGAIWFDTTDKILKLYKNSAWEPYGGTMTLTWTDNSNSLKIKHCGVEQTVTITGFADATEFSNFKTAYNTKIASLESTDTTMGNKLNTLIGSDANKSVRTIANEELAAQLIPSTAKDALDTLEEIAAWIQEHPDSASTMNQKIGVLETWMGTHKNEYSTLNSSVTTIKNSYVSSLTDNATYIELNNTKGSITLSDSALQTKIAALETAITNAASAGVTKFGGQTGEITLTTNSTTNGTVNFGISNKVLSGTVVGLGSAAYTASSAYATSTQGGYANSALQSVESGNSSYLTVGSKSGNNGAKKQTITPVIGVYGGTDGLATTATTATYVSTYVGAMFEWAEF